MKKIIAFLVASLVTMPVFAEEITCLTLVESGEYIGANNYHDRFDGDARRVKTTFDFDRGYFTNFLGKTFRLNQLSSTAYLLEEDPRYVFMYKQGGRAVLEARVEQSAITTKFFECE